MRSHFKGWNLSQDYRSEGVRLPESQGKIFQAEQRVAAKALKRKSSDVCEGYREANLNEQGGQ